MACLSLAACNHVPSQNLLGSFFPSWMLCVLIGIPTALLVRLVLVKAGVDDAVPAKLPVYSALAIAVTFGLWLVLFGN
ncbi:MAG: hypothetical protein F8N37_21800 [Telmatospirillum sp.]|nr:hypothetical protein [Telmatospirillum sp.]